MDWQQLIALGIVAATAGWFLVGWLRRRPAKTPGQCGYGHCGCGVANATNKPGIVYRARKGQRPEVVVKSR